MSGQQQRSLPTGPDRRGLLTAMSMWFLMYAGFFLLMPLLSVHFVDGLGWAAAFIGLVLAVRQFTQQTLTVFGGALADRIGPKRLILMGIFVRAISFAAIGLAETQPMLFAAGVLAALGGALFEAPGKAIVAVLAPEEKLNDVYAQLGVQQNVARTVGPLIGALLIGFEFRWVGMAGAAFFMAAFVVAWIWLPDAAVSTEKQDSFRGIKIALTDRAYVTYIGLLVGFWYMWVQLSIALPLKAKALTGLDSSVGVLFTVNAVLAILLQVPALRFFRRYMYPLPMVISGVLFMAFGLGSVTWVQTIWHLYGSIFFFALGTVLVMPNAQTVTATMANPVARGAYFGVSSLALAVGGGIGQIAGGTLVDAAAATGIASLPWLVSAAVGSSAAVGLLYFYRANRAKVTPRALIPAVGD